MCDDPKESCALWLDARGDTLDTVCTRSQYCGLKGMLMRKQGKDVAIEEIKCTPG